MKTVDVYSNNSFEILNEIKILKENKKNKICAVFMNYGKNSDLYKTLENVGISVISFENFVKMNFAISFQAVPYVRGRL